MSDVRKISCFRVISTFTSTSETPKSPMATGARPTPSIRMGTLNVNRSMPEIVSVPMVPRKIPNAAMQSALDMESPARKVSMMIPRTINEKYSGGPNFRREFGQRGRHQHQTDDAEAPPDERAQGRHPQRRPGPALAGHLIAVEAGHHAGRFPGDVQQDGGGGTAVHGPIIDPGQA